MWNPNLHHTLLGDKLPFGLATYQLWWDLLRGALLRFVWLHHNVVMFKIANATQSSSSVAILIWNQMRTYMAFD